MRAGRARDATGGSVCWALCRPGGTIALGNWAADGYIGRFWTIMGPYLPPPPDYVSPPAGWGRRSAMSSSPSAPSSTRPVTADSGRQANTRHPGPQAQVKVSHGATQPPGRSPCSHSSTAVPTHSPPQDPSTKARTATLKEEARWRVGAGTSEHRRRMTVQRCGSHTPKATGARPSSSRASTRQQYPRRGRL
jgi:hypothetical protein